MMEILKFLKEYCVLISFFVWEICIVYSFIKAIKKGIKCSLRNDILDIYDRCKDSKQITHYQLQSIKYSYDIYKKFKGNSFVDEIVNKINDFEIID